MRTTIGSAHGTLSHTGAWRTTLPWSLCSLGVVVTLVLSVLVVARTAAAPPRATAARIAFLGLGPPPSAAEPPPLVEEFRHALRERGWIEGHNLVIEWRWTAGGLDQFATLVAELVRLPVDVLVVPNSTTAGVAKRVTTTTPIVVAGGGSLLETGLVASLARPGGNITGVHTMSREMTTKRLELLKEAMPAVTRVALLRGMAAFNLDLPAMEEVARSLGMELHLFDVREISETLTPWYGSPMELHLFDVREPAAFDSAFAAMTSAQADALFVFGDPFFLPYRARIAALAAQHRLPSFCGGRLYVEAGCLMSYGPSEVSLYLWQLQVL
jgi:putative ABC transport system substrate-binding protein